MTGDINVTITITADAVQTLLSLLGLSKESREESTKEESKERESTDLVLHHTSSTENNNINNNNYVVDDDVASHLSSSNVVANTPSNNRAVYPPTKEEVAEYIKSKGYDVDPNRFYTYYTRLGWATKSGTSIITTWKETLDGWMTNGRSNTSSSAIQPIDKNNREALKATHPFTPTEF